MVSLFIITMTCLLSAYNESTMNHILSSIKKRIVKTISLWNAEKTLRLHNFKYLDAYATRIRKSFVGLLHFIYIAPMCSAIKCSYSSEITGTWNGSACGTRMVINRKRILIKLYHQLQLPLKQCLLYHCLDVDSKQVHELMAIYSNNFLKII